MDNGHTYIIIMCIFTCVIHAVYMYVGVAQACPNNIEHERYLPSSFQGS